MQETGTIPAGKQQDTEQQFLNVTLSPCPQHELFAPAHLRELTRGAAARDSCEMGAREGTGCQRALGRSEGCRWGTWRLGRRGEAVLPCVRLEEARRKLRAEQK